MSSLAAARADNFYNPPNWDPSKISRDAFQKSRGANQYQQKGLIRFEMPFNFVCDGFKERGHEEHNVGAGTRYNAKKVAAGSYFSTSLWEFQTKCHQCGNPIVIKTDPKNRAYNVIRGGRVKIETYTAKSAEVSEAANEEFMEKREKNKFFDLEVDTQQKEEASASKSRLKELILYKSTREDDYAIAKSVYGKFKAEKRKPKKKTFFDGDLLPPSQLDKDLAKISHLRASCSADTQRKRTRRLSRLQRVAASTEPLFGFKTAVTEKSKLAIRARRLRAARGIEISSQTKGSGNSKETCFSYLRKK